MPPVPQPAVHRANVILKDDKGEPKLPAIIVFDRVSKDPRTLASTPSEPVMHHFNGVVLQQEQTEKPVKKKKAKKDEKAQPETAPEKPKMKITHLLMRTAQVQRHERMPDILLDQFNANGVILYAVPVSRTFSIEDKPLSEAAKTIAESNRIIPPELRKALGGIAAGELDIENLPEAQNVQPNQFGYSAPPEVIAAVKKEVPPHAAKYRAHSNHGVIPGKG